MKQPNSDDISIGENEWIEFRVTDWQVANQVPLDSELIPVAVFLERLEIHCVAACCGVSAFSFWKDDIAAAVKAFDVDELVKNFQAIRKKIADQDAVVYVSQRMNNYFHRLTILELLDHIIRTLIELKGSS